MLNHEGLIFRKISDKGLSKGEKTKLTIIKAAVDTLYQNGLHKFTFENIAAACNLKKSHIAYHFPNKTVLFNMTVRFVFMQGQSQVMSAMKEPDQTPISILKNYIFASHDWILDEPAFGSTVAAMINLASQYNENESNLLANEMRAFGLSRVGELLQQIEEAKSDEATITLLHDWLIGRVIVCATTPASKEMNWDRFKEQTWKVACMISEIPAHLIHH